MVSRSYGLLVEFSVNKKGSRADYISHFQVFVSVSVPQHSHSSRVPGHDERVTLSRGRVAAYDEELPAYESLRSAALSMFGPGL